MIKKSIIVLPALVLGIVFSSSDQVAELLGTNSIYITYNATNDGYFDDGGSLKSAKKSLKVRRGIQWGRRSLKEKPTDPKPYDSDSLLFLDKYTDSRGNVLADDYTINDSMEVYASYGFKETSKDFDLDNWAQLASVTEQGLAKTLEIYNHTEDWFIGKTKKLKLGEVEYTARIIGVDHDELADGSGNKAVFTFEFVETLDPKPLALEQSKTNKYEDSYLRTIYLNNILKNQFSTGIKRAMKKVKKTCNIGEGTSTFPSKGNTVTLEEYIFPLSLKEMNAAKYNEKLSSATYKFPDNEIDEEGTVYDYYNKTDVADLPSLSKINKSSNNYLPYWTRSPELQGKQYTWFINCSNATNYEIGGRDETYYDEQVPSVVTDSLAIAPCFCI